MAFKQVFPKYLGPVFYINPSILLDAYEEEGFI